MIDTHSHIYDKQFDTDRAETVSRAAEAGVSRIILPAVDSESHERLFLTLDQFPDHCLGAMGLHPTSINDNPDWRTELKLAEQLLRDRRYPWVAVGEVGIDLYWSQDFFEQQKEAFLYQAELAIELDLPLIIHTRNAWDEMMELMLPYATRARGVFHSFSGEMHHAQTILDRLDGFMIGLGGPLTYKKSHLPEIAVRIPLERIVLETDSPYLPPEPHRGKRNESSYTRLVAEKLASIHGKSVEDIDLTTSRNATSLFRLSTK